MIIYIRGENNNDEYRNVLIPEHVKILIELGGFVIYVEKSNNRVYSDNEYERCGAILTDLKWYDSQFKDALIIGLKGVKDVELPKLRQHRHVFFSHSYERQVNSNTILHEFCKSRSRIYDFEYFVDNNNKRLLSFGYHAGVVGGLLGILQYIQRKKYNTCIKDLKYWDSIETVIKDNDELATIGENDIKICVIGANGKCGSGVKSILDRLRLKYTVLLRDDKKTTLVDYDIVYNCIKLSSDYNQIWFDKNTIFNKPIIISDISTDYTRKNNPIQLYTKATTFRDPVYTYNQYVDIIAIDNLPSLLPKDSSVDFSKKCMGLLLEYKDDKNSHWRNNMNVFLEKLKHNLNLKSLNF
jgi:saccharopine dehydrogenase (NAD+, L-lysine-forming)